MSAPDLQAQIDAARAYGARFEIERAENCRRLVASDGLWDNLHTEEIVDKVRKGPLRRAVRTVAEECGWRMVNGAEGTPSKPDDLTFILFRLYSTQRKVGQ